MSKPQVFIIGADKGGVGKTTVSATFLDYLKSNTIEHRAFDSECPYGSLKRRYADKTEIVDLTDSDGQMKVFDTLGSAFTVIDIRAALLTPTLTTLKDIGFLDPEKCSLTVMHVLGSSQDSLREVKSIMASLASARYVSVGNRINATKVDFPPGSVEIPMLDAKACEAADALDTSFLGFIGDATQSMVLRGKIKHWLAQVFAQFDNAKLNVAS